MKKCNMQRDRTWKPSPKEMDRSVGARHPESGVEGGVFWGDLLHGQVGSPKSNSMSWRKNIEKQLDLYFEHHWTCISPFWDFPLETKEPQTFENQVGIWLEQSAETLNLKTQTSHSHASFSPPCCTWNDKVQGAQECIGQESTCVVVSF